MQYRPCWSAILSITVAVCSYAIPVARSADNGEGTTVFAGGVAGINDLLTPSNSETYRAKKGGLYLHNSGWATLTAGQKSQILLIFQRNPIAMELGFGSGAAWGDIYRTHYLEFGVRPIFIAVNAFSHNNHPTPEQWSLYSATLRDHGVPPSTLILPTFEYQNFSPNINTLSTLFHKYGDAFLERLGLS